MLIRYTTHPLGNALVLTRQGRTHVIPGLKTLKLDALARIVLFYRGRL